MKGILGMVLVRTSASWYRLMWIWSVRKPKLRFVLHEARSGEIIRIFSDQYYCMRQVPGVLPALYCAKDALTLYLYRTT